MIGFFRDNAAEIGALTLEHCTLVGLSLLIASAIGVPLGILITRRRDLAGRVINGANICMTIPSIALFGLMLPVLAVFGHGLGKVPAVAALVLYSQLPIIRNTYVAIRNVPPAVVDAGRGMGMGTMQLLREVEIPLAAPVILAGLRTAAVMNIGIAAIAAYIGAGGLGVYIQQGIDRVYDEMILCGALCVSLLAIGVDGAMALLERIMTPKGLRVERRVKGS
ncbi:ABC transporter permease [Kiritimatiella glycovorans]|uniref:Glycine betaine/carnitine/choline transport system permease protein OpuCB n=1 Tax=Kiritimatiella glycovorans TaxID=1307763 RepID=A0A0G3ELK6_9BACT|nr:ABC transporter permease [Kiritimatiella glycovorans]AKJ65670.1 Glycine betaine/carnitine/choline transport system permease protein OpuCB [Kiritimatiella glycovorans]